MLAWIVVLACLLLAAGLRLRLLPVPLERDEGEYAYAGQLLLQGIPPYQLAYNMKFPGTYVAYAVILGLFGHTPQAIHLGLLLVNAASALLLFLLGRRVVGELSAAAATAAFLWLSVGPEVYGFAAHATHFVGLFALLGLLCLLRGLEHDRLGGTFAAGVCLGVATLCKQHGALLALFGGVWLLWATRAWAWPRRGRKVAALVLGGLLPLLGTCVWLLHAGVLGKFWHWTFAYASQYSVRNDQPLRDFTFNADLVMTPNWPIWLFAACAPLLGRRVPGVQRGFLALLFGFSFLSICPGFYFRGHYFVLLLPALALAFGVSTAGLSQHLGRRGAALSLGLVLGLLLQRAVAHRIYVTDLTPTQICDASYWPNPFVDSPALGQYLRDHTAATDRIGVIGSEPQIYFYAGRKSATGYIYTYPLMEVQPYAESMQREMIAELEATRPAYLVLVNVPLSWLPRPGSPRLLLPWASSFAAEHYQPDAVLELLSRGHSRLSTGPEVASAAPRTPYTVWLLRRKPGHELRAADSR